MDFCKIILSGKTAMQGIIIAYSSDVAAGVIKSMDGHQYYFNSAQWASSEIKPEGNLVVNFEPEEKYARNVSASSKNIR